MKKNANLPWCKFFAMAQMYRMLIDMAKLTKDGGIYSRSTEAKSNLFKVAMLNVVIIKPTKFKMRNKHTPFYIVAEAMWTEKKEHIFLQSTQICFVLLLHVNMATLLCCCTLCIKTNHVNRLCEQRVAMEVESCHGSGLWTESCRAKFDANHGKFAKCRFADQKLKHSIA